MGHLYGDAPYQEAAVRWFPTNRLLSILRMINVNLTGSSSPELTPITFPINRLAECTGVVP